MLDREGVHPPPRIDAAKETRAIPGASDKPLRVGLVGYGFAGRTFHAPLIAATPGLALVAVASGDEAKVRADLPGVRVFADPYEMLGSGIIDLVVIASPNLTHFPLANAAIDGGVHVVVDKPFTPTLEEARILRNRAEPTSVMLSVFQNRRWDSDYLGIRSAIESGRLGHVVHFESRIDRYRPQVRDRWREADLPASGLWFDLGPHLVDQALQLFGLPEAVLASFATQRSGALVDDWAHVVLDFGATRAVLHCSMLATGTTRFAVHGTKGTAIKFAQDQQEAQLLAGIAPGDPGWGEDPDPLVMIDEHGARSEIPVRGDQRRFYAAVVDHLRGRGPNPVPVIQAIAVTTVLEAAAAAAKTGQSMAIDLDDSERASWARSLQGIRSS